MFRINQITSSVCVGLLTATAAVCLLCSASFAAGTYIENDTFWKDISGNPIYSQGGGVFKFGDTYYWYGARYEAAQTYYSTQKRVSASTFHSITCYSSTDLVNWKFENDVLTAEPGGRLDPSVWVGRMGVAYNENTKKYILVSQFQGTPNTEQLFATCSTPNGKFTVDHTQATITNVANGTPGDQTIFIDDDGKAYVILSSCCGRANTYVAPLRESDFLEVEPATRVFGGAGREGNCMFKYNSKYYICSSDLHGWNASQCYYISSDNILGPYTPEAIMTNSEKDFCHVTQTGFFITLKGTAQSTVLFCGDRWADFAGNGIGYNQWCPLSFDGSKPGFNSLTQFSINAVTGTWSVGPDNNYVLNPGFEADRVTATALAGWKTEFTSGSASNSNAASSHTAGNFCMQQTSGTAYTARTYQNIAGLSKGTYTLTAWVQSSGGQKTCQLYINDFGSAEMSTAIAKESSWTKIVIDNIPVANGKCQVGIRSDANADNWVRVDDVALVNNSPTTVAAGLKQRSTRKASDVCISACSNNVLAVPDRDYQDVKSIAVFDLQGNCLKKMVTSKGYGSLESVGIPNGLYVLRILER